MARGEIFASAFRPVTALAILLLLLAVGPAILFMRNLRVFTPPSRQAGRADEVSILIPARNEERNIETAISFALANEGAEVIVLDDFSTDGTAELIAREARVRLISGAALPNEWCGKNWACAQLATAATRPVLLFVDADVRLAPDAAASIASWMREQSAHLVSGVPRQELGGFTERLLIPLIHFVLLAFLPLRRMRQSRHPAYATGCGQLMCVKAEAYRASGGHGAIRQTTHDGLALPKVLREHGFCTDLFDATELATCRMYRSASETWRGFSKNAHEGLGAPARIVPATILLLGGQVLPFVLLALAPRVSVALLAAVLALLPRLLAARRFSQPSAMIILHPVAIVALLGIQWTGLLRFLRGKAVSWKGRVIPTSGSARFQRAGEGILPSELS